MPAWDDSSRDNIEFLRSEFEGVCLRLTRFYIVRVLVVTVIGLALANGLSNIETGDIRAKLSQIEQLTPVARFSTESPCKSLSTDGNPALNDLCSQLDVLYAKAFVVPLSLLGVSASVDVSRWFLLFPLFFLTSSVYARILSLKRRFLLQMGARLLALHGDAGAPLKARLSFSENARSGGYGNQPFEFLSGMNRLATTGILAYLTLAAFPLFEAHDQASQSAYSWLLALAVYHCWLYSRYAAAGFRTQFEHLAPEAIQPSRPPHFFLRTARRMWRWIRSHVPRPRISLSLGGTGTLCTLMLLVLMFDRGCGVQEYTGLEVLRGAEDLSVYAPPPPPPQETLNPDDPAFLPEPEVQLEPEHDPNVLSFDDLTLAGKSEYVWFRIYRVFYAAQILSAVCGLLLALIWRLLPSSGIPSLLLRSLLAVTGAGTIFFLSSWIMLLPYFVAWGLSESMIGLVILPSLQLYLVGYLAWKWVGLIRSMTETAMVRFSAFVRMVALAAAPSLAMVAAFAVALLSEPPGFFGTGYAILPVSGLLLTAGYFGLHRTVSD